MTIVSPQDAVVALRFERGRLIALDQTALPWREEELVLASSGEVAAAIRRLAIRGAPLIGVAAGYGVAIELARSAEAGALEHACADLTGARPTAANLARAVRRVRHAALAAPRGDEAQAALAQARA